MSNNMCSKLEICSLIYGILTIILSTMGILIGLEFMMLLNTMLTRGTERVLYNHIVLAGISPGFFLIAFSVVLICGICMKKPALVLIFLIFGTVISVLASSLALYFMSCYIEGGMLLTFLIYSLPLIVVYKTYKMLIADRNRVPLETQLKSVSDIVKGTDAQFLDIRYTQVY